MSKVFLCTHETLHLSGISKPLHCTGDSLYVNDLTCSLTFPPSILMKKCTCREISRGMYPTVIKLEKYLFFILLAQAYGSVSNDDAVVSNSAVTFISNCCVYSRCCFINVVTPWSHSCFESKSIHVSCVVWVLCWFNRDNIFQFTFHFECYCSLHFECYCVYFISNITIDRLFHNPMLLLISFEHLMVEKFIHSNKWSSFEKEYRKGKSERYTQLFLIVGKKRII